MNANKKQELTQLLHEVLANLEIRSSHSGLPSVLPVGVYKGHLQDSWSTFSDSPSWVESIYNVHITDDNTELKILDFLRELFVSFIDDEDRIQSANIRVNGGLTKSPLDHLLQQLLKVTIVQGVEKAISTVDRCTTDTHVPFQYMALLESIRVEEKIEIFDGIRLIPLSSSTSELPHYLPSTFNSELSVSFTGKTVLIIDASVSPIFAKAGPEGFRIDHLPFSVEVNSKELSNFNEMEFYEKICYALSLSCNSAVQVSMSWQFLKPDELCNISFGGGGYSRSLGADVFGGHSVAGMSQVQKAKDIYDDFDRFDPGKWERMLIAINRWIKSKTSQIDVDKMIDLGIAFESLYVPESSSESTFKLGIRSACHLRKDPADRKTLKKTFGEIYKWRSSAVHTGKLPKKTKNFSPEEIKGFIEDAQSHCRDAILKILKEGKFPDWDDVILGCDENSLDMLAGPCQ